MPKLAQSGEQIKLFLSDRLRHCLENDAYAAGQKHIQPIIRHILVEHYSDRLTSHNSAQNPAESGTLESAQ